MSDSTGHMPDGKWAFDANVTAVFDDMIERSIPQYATMRAACNEITNHVLGGRRANVVLDLGCSSGIAIRDLSASKNAERVVGVEVSGPMLEVVRERFASYANVEIVEMDLRYAFPDVQNVDIVTSVFTLQFIPVEHRARLVRRIYESMRPGGVFLIVEKVLGSSAFAQDMFVSLYHAMKERNGYSREAIERKALSLEGALVPLSERGNVAQLEVEGFRVESFWRWMNFMGWIAVKPDV